MQMAAVSIVAAGLSVCNRRIAAPRTTIGGFVDFARPQVL